MKALVFILLALTSVSLMAAKPAPKVTASVYTIVMDTSIDGIKSSSSITVREGDKGSIESVQESLGGRFQEVTVRKTELDGKEALHMDFIVGEIDRFGNKTLVATPKITSNIGEKATVIMGEAAGGKKLIFSARAKPATK